MSSQETASNRTCTVLMNLNAAEPPSVKPEKVVLDGETQIRYELDKESIAAGYYFAGYMDNTPGTGSQLTGKSIDNGAGYQLEDLDDDIPGTQISVTLFIRNSLNPKVRFTYDPEIVNNH